MTWMNWLRKKSRWKLVHGSKLPKADLRSCLWRLAERGFRPREIIDVGAHRAKWSTVARMVFPDAGYTLIEPQQEMQPQLQKFCAGRNNCRFFLAGAGSQPGELPFSICPDTSASNFVYTAQETKDVGGYQRIVPIITLDSVVADHLPCVPELVKIDAEGFEQEVLKGAQSLIGKTELFFLESTFFGKPGDPSLFSNLVAFMAERGYMLHDFSWFYRHPDHGALFLCEALFARRDGMFRSAHQPAAQLQAA